MNGTVIGAFEFFDGVFLGAPIEVLAASFRPALVYAVATMVVILLVIACCGWVDRRWEDWFSGPASGSRTRLEAMRAGRLMPPPVEWIREPFGPLVRVRRRDGEPNPRRRTGQDHGGEPIGKQRSLLGAVAYALSSSQWTIVGFALGGALRAA